jgi:hypothetical protein
MPCLDGPTQAVSTQIQHRTAAHTKLETCPAPSGNPSKRLTIPPPSSRDAFCDLPICPTTCSTASADMEQPFGAKAARSCWRLMPWIAANHGIEGAASTSAAGKNCQPMSPRRDCHLVGNSSVEKIWVRFAKPAYVRSITACSLGPSRRTGLFQKLVGGSSAVRPNV